MVTVILTHEVKNISDWKKAFDAGAPLREKSGVKTHGVYHSIDKPNHITVVTEFPSQEAVNGFMANPELKEAMEKSGVVGKPDILLLNKF